MPKGASKQKSPPVSRKPQWTIIVLMAAESNLEEDFKEVYDQMAVVGSNQGEVGCVGICDGLKLPGKPAGRVSVYHVIRNNFFQDVSEKKKGYVKRFSKKLDNLANAKNLKEVLRYVKKKFPAKHFGFIYKGHGGPNPDITDTRYIRKATFRGFIKGKEESNNQIIKRVQESLPKIHVAKNGKNGKGTERE